jgi:rhodanese-related sulfurtransferase
MNEQDLNPETVCDMLSGRLAVLIDVREPAEFGTERIHGGLNMPLSSFDPMAIPNVRAQTIVFQCGSGKRSRTALDAFLSSGRDEPAAHLAGGLAAWKEARLPLVRIDPATGRIVDPGRF